MFFFAFVVRFVKLAALFIGAANAYIITWLTLSWLWNSERTAEFLTTVQASSTLGANRAYFYRGAITPFVFGAYCFWYVAVTIYTLLLYVVTNVNLLVFSSRVVHTVFCRFSGFCMLQLVSCRLLFVGVSNWTVYLLLYSFFVAASLCYRADATYFLVEHQFIVVPDFVFDLYMDYCATYIQQLSDIWAGFYANVVQSSFQCYRESFKDIPMEAVGSPDSMANAVQIVRTLPFDSRVILLTLGQTVYHNGKFPKSKKTVGFEYGLLSAAFPHVCEGISADNLSSRHATHVNQAGLIGAMGRFYIVYCLFVMAVIEKLVVRHGGSKVAPSRESCYRRIDAQFNRRNRASTVQSTFKLSGAGFLSFKAEKDKMDASKAPAKTSRRTRGLAQGTEAGEVKAQSLQSIF